MIHLLTDTALYYPAGNGCYLQLTGKSIFDLPILEERRHSPNRRKLVDVVLAKKDLMYTRVRRNLSGTNQIGFPSDCGYWTVQPSILRLHRWIVVAHIWTCDPLAITYTEPICRCTMPNTWSYNITVERPSQSCTFVQAYFPLPVFPYSILRRQLFGGHSKNAKLQDSPTPQIVGSTKRFSSRHRGKI